jgi:hypothetical protein
MPHQQGLKFAKDDWENEGGALPEIGLSGVTRFLTELYVVDGFAYANLSDASARVGALCEEVEKP